MSTEAKKPSQNLSISTNVAIDFKKIREDVPSPRPEAPEDLDLDSKGNDVVKRKSTFSVFIPNSEETEVFCLQYSPDNRFLASGCGDGSVRIFNTVGRLSYTINVGGTNKLPTTCIKFRPLTALSQTAGVLLAGNADGTVSHWHIASQKCMYSIQEEENQIYAVEYRNDAEFFATAGRDCKVRVYEENTKTLVRTMTSGKTKMNSGHSNRVYALKFKPDDPNIILSGGWDNTVQMWDTRVGASVRSIYGPHICGEGLDVLGDHILTASWRPDNALQVWDFGSGKLIKDITWSYGKSRSSEESTPVVIKKLPEMLYAAAFSSDGNFIAAGGCGTNEGKIFDVKNDYKIIDRVFMGQKGVYCLSFSPNCKKLSFAGGTQEVMVCDLK